MDAATRGKTAAERLADHLSREETLADFVADGED